MKSTTCPWAKPGARKRRSSRCEVAPPRTAPRTTVQAGERSRRPTYRTTATAAAAVRVNTHVVPVPIENAAPGFNSSRSRMSRGITVMPTPSESAETAQYLESWSTSRTSAASTSIQTYGRVPRPMPCGLRSSVTMTSQPMAFSRQTLCRTCSRLDDRVKAETVSVGVVELEVIEDVGHVLWRPDGHAEFLQACVFHPYVGDAVAEHPAARVWPALGQLEPA